MLLHGTNNEREENARLLGEKCAIQSSAAFFFYVHRITIIVIIIMSAVTESLLSETIGASLSAVDVLSVSDLSDGCGSKFSVVVVSSDFSGVTLINRHKRVHEAIGEELLSKIHAVTIKAWTPEQYEKKKKAGKAA